MRTRSACVLLAWGVLLLLAAAGSTGSPRPAPANNRTATSTTSINSPKTTTTVILATLTSTQTSTPTTGPASRTDAATTATAAAATAARPAPQRGTRAAATTPTSPGATYVVQPGDTLSAIAFALGTRGGWPALYAANRRAIGPDPDVIRAGLALTLPGPGAPTRYTIAAGDTLAGIAAALRTRGGWPALYAANRRAIGPDPDVIRADAVLTIPPRAPASRPARRPAPPPATARALAPTRTPATASSPARPTAPAPGDASAKPTAKAKAPASASAKTPAAGGLPRWLQLVLLTAGLLIGAAFLAEPALAITRRRRNARQNVRPATGPTACPTADRRILLADYDRLVVTSSGPDGTVCVLRPPGADPEVILLAARLVLAQDRYEELAGHLGVALRRRE